MQNNPIFNGNPIRQEINAINNNPNSIFGTSLEHNYYEVFAVNIK